MAAPVPQSNLCPGCNVAGPARLLPGERCAVCRTQAAWTDLGDKGLVIDRAAIDDAVQRRAGEAAGQPLWRRALIWLPLALTLGVATLAALSLRALLASRPIGPLAALLAELLSTSRRTTLLGLLGLVLAVIAVIRLRRRRHYRRLPFVLGHAVAAVICGCALPIGALHWYAFHGGSGWRYTSMPARAPMAATAAVDRIINATVVVMAPDAAGDASNPGLGTGAIVAADDRRAWIVTCSHVAMPYVAVGAIRHARDAQPVWVQLADGREGRATVRWAAPPPLDVVVLELPMAHPPEPVTISRDASALQESASVTFVPNPYRAGWLVHQGRVLRREPHHTSAGAYDLLLTDLPVTFGDSGSGLFDSRGQLVGLNTWTRMGPDGPAQGISLPSETMRAVVDAIEGDRLDQLDDARPPPPRE